MMSTATIRMNELTVTVKPPAKGTLPKRKRNKSNINSLSAASWHARPQSSSIFLSSPPDAFPRKGKSQDQSSSTQPIRKPRRPAEKPRSLSPVRPPSDVNRTRTRKPDASNHWKEFSEDWNKNLPEQHLQGSLSHQKPRTSSISEASSPELANLDAFYNTFSNSMSLLETTTPEDRLFSPNRNGEESSTSEQSEEDDLFAVQYKLPLKGRSPGSNSTNGKPVNSLEKLSELPDFYHTRYNQTHNSRQQPRSVITNLSHPSSVASQSHASTSVSFLSNTSQSISLGNTSVASVGSMPSLASIVEQDLASVGTNLSGGDNVSVLTGSSSISGHYHPKHSRQRTRPHIIRAGSNDHPILLKLSPPATESEEQPNKQDENDDDDDDDDDDETMEEATRSGTSSSKVQVEFLDRRASLKPIFSDPIRRNTNHIPSSHCHSDHDRFIPHSNDDLRHLEGKTLEALGPNIANPHKKISQRRWDSEGGACGGTVGVGPPSSWRTMMMIPHGNPEIAPLTHLQKNLLPTKKDVMPIYVARSRGSTELSPKSPRQQGPTKMGDTSWKTLLMETSPPEPSGRGLYRGVLGPTRSNDTLPTVARRGGSVEQNPMPIQRSHGLLEDYDEDDETKQHSGVTKTRKQKASRNTELPILIPARRSSSSSEMSSPSSPTHHLTSEMLLSAEQRLGSNDDVNGWDYEHIEGRGSGHAGKAEKNFISRASARGRSVPKPTKSHDSLLPPPPRRAPSPPPPPPPPPPLPL